MGARVQVAEGPQQAQHRLLLLGGGVVGVVGGEGVQDGPGVETELAAVEGALLGLEGGAEGGAQGGERVLPANQLPTVLLFRHN